MQLNSPLLTFAVAGLHAVKINKTFVTYNGIHCL